MSGEVDIEGDSEADPPRGTGLVASNEPCTRCGSELDVMILGGAPLCQCCIVHGTCWRTNRSYAAKHLESRTKRQREEVHRVDKERTATIEKIAAAKVERERKESEKTSSKQIDAARLMQREVQQPQQGGGIRRPGGVGSPG